MSVFNLRAESSYWAFRPAWALGGSVTVWTYEGAVVVEVGKDVHDCTNYAKPEALSGLEAPRPRLLLPSQFKAVMVDSPLRGAKAGC